MTRVDEYLGELAAALRVRGAVRRRFLRECRDHLSDACAGDGEAEALRRFGDPSAVAAEFDAEVAARRGVRSTVVAVAGVLATGGSTLALIHASSTRQTAPLLWAIAFFVGAQIAAVAAALASAQALANRRAPISPAEVLLLCRRNGCALVAAGVTMFAAGAAAPGHASAVVLLAGPMLACVGLAAVLRARALAGRLEGARALVFRPPLEDLARLTRLPVPVIAPRPLLALTMCVAGAAAFARDRGEHATVGQALGVAGIEVAAVLVCFLLLGRLLGLRTAAARGGR